MSVCLTFICDGSFPEGDCPQRLTLRTVEISAADALADMAGWSVKEGTHKCPSCARAGR